MQPTTLEIHFDQWESLSDGLILFDSSGNFRACSPKALLLAGSESALRRALDSASWPRDFACRRQTLFLAGQIPALNSGGTGPAEMVCVRTSDGFVAVLTPALSAPNSLAEIFSGLVRERQAMSRHLHNALTQDLVALSLSLSGIAADSGESLSSAVAHIDRCCRGVRALTYVLSPPAFLNAGLIETIEWYGDVLRADAGVHFVLDPGTLPADPPEPIKELLFAALQHVAATAIWQPGGAVIRLSIRYFAGSILMRIECACRSDEPLRESPLVRERARTLGGVTRFSSAIGNASLEVSIPWSPEAVPQSSSQ